MRESMANASGVFGDGLASERTVLAIKRFFGFEVPDFEEFAPAELERVSLD
jgi:hypothetical protein